MARLLALLALPAVSAAAAALFGAELDEVAFSSGEAALPFADLAKHCSTFMARRWSGGAWVWESEAAVVWSASLQPPLGPGVPLRLVGKKKARQSLTVTSIAETHRYTGGKRPSNGFACAILSNALATGGVNVKA